MTFTMSNLQKILQICSWNACGIQNKLQELEIFLNRYNVDVLLINECRSKIFSIPGFHVYTATNPTSQRKGGAATIIRHGISHTVVAPVEKDNLQICPILYNNTILASIYCPPAKKWSTEAFTHIFNQMDEMCHPQSLRFILAGDWNAKSQWWGNARSCSRGKMLAEAILSKPRYNILATGGATHFPFNQKANPSAIDFAVYSGFLASHISITSANELTSDHVPILITVSTGMIPLSPPSPDQNSASPLPLPRGSQSIRAFQKHLEKLIHLNTEICSGNDIEDCVDILLKNIELAATHASSTTNRVSTNTNKRPHHSKIRLDKTARLLLEKALACQQAMLTDPSPVNKENYSRAKNKLKKAVKYLKRARMERMLTDLDPADRYNMAKIWRITRHIKRQPPADHPLKIPLQYETHRNLTKSQTYRWSRTPKEKADAFAKHLEERFSPRMNLKEEEEKLTLLYKQNSRPVHSPQSPPLAPVSFKLEELLTQISSLASAKSPGEDRISNSLIKLLPKKAVLYLLYIFNSILRIGHFPRQWKLAIITMIHKSGKSTHCPDSYRPISLLSGFGKLFERLLLPKLMECRLFSEAIPGHQFGFRPEHSAEQQILRVTQHVLKAFEEKEKCSAVFLDFSQAFDRVWHKGLLLKLKRILPPQLLKVLTAYLENRKFKVKGAGSIRSRLGTIKAGVPQGSILGPILYLIFTSDMPLPDIVPSIARSNTHSPGNFLLSTYADDTAILYKHDASNYHSKQLQAYLDAISSWANTWGMSFNVKKCSHVTFNLGRPTAKDIKTQLLLDGQTIPHAISYKYLGLTLDSKLNMNKHITQICIRTRARAKSLNWLLGPTSPLPRQTKATLIKQLIIPLWQYAIPVWASLASESAVLRAQQTTNSIIRRALGYDRHVPNKDIARAHKIKTLEEIYQAQSTRLANSLASHINPVAQHLSLHMVTPECTKKTRPRLAKQIEEHFKESRKTHQQPCIIPTLLRLNIKKEDDAAEDAKFKPKYVHPNFSSSGINRLGERAINWIRKSYVNREISLQRAERMLRGQPLMVRRLVLPDIKILPWEINIPPDLIDLTKSPPPS